MRRSDFHYELPPELIAQQPAARRSDSRLLCVEPGAALADRRMTDLPSQLRAGDLLVFNDTRVIPARLFGRKDSGGKVEVLVERLLDASEMLAQVRASKAPRAGGRIAVDGDVGTLQVLGREQEFWRLRYDGQGSALALLQRAGHMPLPPYIAREDAADDRDRYQTVFARAPGAVAAPTAGLHFDDALLRTLAAAGIATTTVTLHVGAGTFQPLRAEDLAQHRMHAERYSVSAAAVAAIAAARARGGRVTAVGTTVVRTLESAARDGTLAAQEGETELFITPGFSFRVVDRLLTNFHLPESTLLILVCAFGGRERMLAAYRHAVAQRYRFFSYGDAMLIDPAVTRAVEPRS